MSLSVLGFGNATTAVISFKLQLLPMGSTPSPSRSSCATISVSSDGTSLPSDGSLRRTRGGEAAGDCTYLSLLANKAPAAIPGGVVIVSSSPPTAGTVTCERAFKNNSNSLELQWMIKPLQQWKPICGNCSLMNCERTTAFQQNWNIGNNI